MFINDDGLQIISEEDRQARIEFYADHSIGWTARPKHGKDGFIRKGKFKKVRLLLNYSLQVSLAKILYSMGGCFGLDSLLAHRKGVRHSSVLNRI